MSTSSEIESLIAQLDSNDASYSELKGALMEQLNNISDIERTERFYESQKHAEYDSSPQQPIGTQSSNDHVQTSADYTVEDIKAEHYALEQNAFEHIQESDYTTSTPVSIEAAKKSKILILGVGLGALGAVALLIIFALVLRRVRRTRQKDLEACIVEMHPVSVGEKEMMSTGSLGMEKGVPVAPSSSQVTAAASPAPVHPKLAHG